VIVQGTSVGLDVHALSVVAHAVDEETGKIARAPVIETTSATGNRLLRSDTLDVRARGVGFLGIVSTTST
jgi:hypothetical protein